MVDMEPTCALWPGTYIVAVSGGIDSMVLLDMVARLVAHRPREYRCIVAHFDHGIRDDSGHDASAVAERARTYGLDCVVGHGRLGRSAGEATARQARYRYLDGVAASIGGRVVTAHHADDVIETCLIQIVRGTGWRGLTGLTDARYERPLLAYAKAQLAAYAIDHGLDWVEDSTNESAKFLRNRVRMTVVPHITSQQRQTLLGLWRQQVGLREAIDAELAQLVGASGEMSRYALANIPWACSLELVGQAVRMQTGESLTRPQLESIAMMARTARPGAIKLPNKVIRVVATARSLIVAKAKT